MNTREKKLLKQAPVLGDFNAKDYTSERIFATARDGTRIPISLVYKTALKQNNMPLSLNGYGAYGIDSDPYFSYSRLSLLNRGFIYAIAHIRGGGEYGDAWHEAGRFLHKKNTFTDFIDCAKYLIEQQYTSADQMIISGGSAGGLLIGAVLNEAPELFRAAIAHVPFVDVLNTMLDEKLPLTVLEYEEWGNPHDPTYYEYIRSYAPYENVRQAAYPTVFATAGLNDPRVPYWEAAKWVARLRDNQINDAPILLKVQMSAGHQGPTGRYHEIEEVAEEFSFILGFVLNRNASQ
jgi:oligopeptidase B